MLVGEERFELSISRVRAERFKLGLATPLHVGDDGGTLSFDRAQRHAQAVRSPAISRLRFRWLKPTCLHRQTLGEVDGSRTHLVLIDSEVPLLLGHHSVNLVSRSGLEPESERS